MASRLRIFLWFALVGPLVGGWLTVIWFFYDPRWLAEIPAREMLPAAAVLAFYGALGGYVLGLLPAIMAGAVMAAFRPAPIARHTVSAAVVSAGASLLRSGITGDGIATLRLGGVTPAHKLALIAGLAGAICWLMVVATTRRAPPATGPIG